MKVLLGVTGGIAAYKAAALVREFKRRGDEVRVVMTHGAQEFISPLTLQVLSQEPVGTAIFDPTYESQIGHIELARWPDVVLVAPATAQVISKMAQGMADDLLTTVLLATRAPVVVAPAMNTQMYLHPAVQDNMRRLVEVCGYQLVTPDAGELACQEVGPGRLPDPPVLLEAVDRALTPQRLTGKTVLISAGPTREHIDPARFISNPSTGKMGYALAQAAARQGAFVTLVSGPTGLEAPIGVERVSVTTAVQMHEQIMARAADADVVVKVAAVADWRPADPSEQKRTKGEMSGQLALVRNPDILAGLGERFGPGQTPGPLLVGFAAESHDVLERGIAKLARKNAHMLIANQIGGASNAFGADESSAYVIFAGQAQPTRALGPAPKLTLSGQIWSAIYDEMRRLGRA